MTVNVVRKATNKEDIQTVAKSLIKSWKKLLGLSFTPILYGLSEDLFFMGGLGASLASFRSHNVNRNGNVKTCEITSRCQKILTLPL